MKFIAQFLLFFAILFHQLFVLHSKLKHLYLTHVLFRRKKRRRREYWSDRLEMTLDFSTNLSNISMDSRCGSVIIQKATKKNHVAQLSSALLYQFYFFNQDKMLVNKKWNRINKLSSQQEAE